MLLKSAVLFALSLPSIVSAQLASGKIGPLTTVAQKTAVKVCDVTKYGAVADLKTDLGPPLAAAFAACKNGGIVNIPAGSYAMATWVTLSGGSAWGINLEGVIYRTGTAGGHMIIIEKTTDFELYSSRSSGAIQGYGYKFHESGTYGKTSSYPTDQRRQLFYPRHCSCRLLLLSNGAKAPAFHLILDTVSNGEVYNLIIRGGNEGGLDGIDVWGFNMHIHDVEVTNKDECVTVKSPSNHFLIENIYCNWSGGCAIGSLGADTAVSEITYNNVYTWESNQMFMIKSNGGSGSVSNSVFSNFIGHSNAYSLDINGYWESALAAGNGVLFTGLTFNNWKGTCSAGATRGPINVICPDSNPCDGITIENFAMWTESGTYEYYKCESAWGSGGCLRAGSAHTSYAVSTVKVATAPSGYSAPKMPNDLGSGLGITASIAIPTVPTTFFPGATPATKRAYP